MTKKKKNNTTNSSPRQSDGPSPIDPDSLRRDDSEFPDINDEEMMKEISELQKDNPELMQSIFNELNNWRDDFINEYGHEPMEEDLMAIFDDEDSDGLDNFGEGTGDEGLPKICESCSWCSGRLELNEKRFSFGVKTRIDVTPFDDPTRPLVITLSDQKTILAIVTTQDSQARKDGYQLLVMCCSKGCVDEAQQALQDAIDIDNLTMLN